MPEFGYDATNVMRGNAMQAGTAAINKVDMFRNTLTVTFPIAFTSIPHVVATPHGGEHEESTCHIRSVSTTQVVIEVRFLATAPSDPIKVSWIAVAL